MSVRRLGVAALALSCQLLCLDPADAQQQGFAIVSLVAFEQNSRAVALYRRLGFEIISRRPAVPHALVHHSGDLLLMMRL